MEGSSPGTSVNPPSLGGEISGAREGPLGISTRRDPWACFTCFAYRSDACPSDHVSSVCNRKCAPLECTFELPKSIQIWVKRHEVRKMKNERNDEVGNDKEANSTLSNSGEGKENNEYLRVKAIDRDGNFIGEDFELSWSNFMRTISTSSQVEEVRISLQGASQKTSRALGECMNTIPSLKSLHLEDIRSSELSVSDAEGIFSAFGPYSTLQTGGVIFASGYEPTKAAIVKVLVDALLQNQSLCQFSVRYWGVYRYTLRSKEWAGCEGSVMRELNRYMDTPTNVLTKLEMYGVEDDEVIQLADTLGVNEKLQKLKIGRTDNSSHSEGIGRIGEALRTNTVLGELYFDGDTMLAVEEMEALVGALVPDAASGLQPNTHLHTLQFGRYTLEGREGMDQLSTLLRSNTSLLHLDLSNFYTLRSGSEHAVEYAEILVVALWFNTSLESLDLSHCSGIGGEYVLGMIMDMLLHNCSLREIKLEYTGLEDGDVEGVNLELRGRGKTIDRRLDKAVQNMMHVPPNSGRVFLCGDPKAGKTTLCKKWEDIQLLSTCETKGGDIDDDKLSNLTICFKPSISTPSSGVLEPALPFSAHELPPSSSVEEQTHGIKVHKMLWEDMNISLWDLAGQGEYHTFHDMMLPNRSANGDCCFYFIVCNPTYAVQQLKEEMQMELLEKQIKYWLVFIASNTRRSRSYLPHVAILMTHHDLWGADKCKEKIFRHKITHIIRGLMRKFQLFLEFDQDEEFIEMENTSTSSGDAMELKQRVLQYLKKLSVELPEILKASVKFQSTIMKWRGDSSKEPFVKWDVLSNSLSQEVMELQSLKDVGTQLLEKIKKHVAVSLHNGGYIMYFEEIDVVILDPHWFCQNIIGHILFNYSELNVKGAIAANGIISPQVFEYLVFHGENKGRFKEILTIMTELQICYEDGDGNIMIPSLLDGNPIPTNWDKVFGSSAETFTHVGLQLKTADESITKLTPGFFPRLQVYLHNKFRSTKTHRLYSNAKTFTHVGLQLKTADESITKLTPGFFPRLQVYLHNKFRSTKTYRLYSNAKTLSLFTKGISFILDGVELFILLDMEDSINIISRCCGGGDSENRRVHKTILDCVNDFRQTPTFGCPGVIFEEHVIFPYSVENALGAKKLQCISKKQLREEMVDKILRKGDFTNALDWVDEKGVSRYVHAKELLGEKEWLDILHRRSQKLTDMDKVLDSKLPTRNSNAPAASIHSNNNLVRVDSTKRFIADEIDSLKRLMQHNHKEVMTRLDELEKNIMGFQQKLTSRVCSNIDSLMECLLQLNNSNIPKLPYFTKSAGSGGKRILLKMLPGLESYQLQFMCEHRDGFHNVEDQPGCEVEISKDQSRKFGIVMYWGLTISVMLLKVGAHVTAGMGSMVPDLTREFATILDSRGLLDLAQPRGEILDCLPDELEEQPHINRQDNEEAKAWLVQILDKKCPPGGMHRMFKLTQMVYTSKSDNKGGIAWLCDSHRDMGERDGSLTRS